MATMSCYHVPLKPAPDPLVYYRNTRASHRTTSEKWLSSLSKPEEFANRKDAECITKPNLPTTADTRTRFTR